MIGAMTASASPLRTTSPGSAPRYRSVFAPGRRRERRQNFEAYWAYTVARDGDLLEDEKDLREKKALVARFQANPVRSRHPLADPEVFYRNCVRLHVDPRAMDRKTLLLTFLYKFARHEWVGVSAAWDETPSLAASTTMTARISRYHLCEEFCHLRLFEEMFRTFHLDRVEWVPLGKWMGRVYHVFPHVPGPLMAPPAFVTELMGLTFYLHLDRLLDDVLASEPEARGRVRELAARDHDRRAGPRGPAAQLPRPARRARSPRDGAAHVPRLLSRRAGGPAPLRHRGHDPRRARVRLQHDRALRAAAELGPDLPADRRRRTVGARRGSGKRALDRRSSGRYCYRTHTKEALMFSYVRQVGIPTALAQEAPAFLAAFVIAEVFYKFKSFTLECAAFLVTWYVLSWIQSLIVGPRKK